MRKERSPKIWKRQEQLEFRGTVDTIQTTGRLEYSEESWRSDVTQTPMKYILV